MIKKIDKIGFSDRLNKALDKEGFPPKNKGRAQLLAEMMGLTKAGIGKWINGLSCPPEKNYQALADKLSVREEWLRAGHGVMLSEKNIADMTEKVQYEQEVPLYRLENLNVPLKMVKCTVPIQGKGLAFSLKSDAMNPRFPENSIIIIDTEKPKKHGDFVLVKHPNFPTPIFRQLIIIDDEKSLLAHNPKFERLYLENQDDIIGVMIQAIISFF